MLRPQHTLCVQLLALSLLGSPTVTALRHDSARQSYSVCTGSATEVVLCKRDSWLASEQSQAHLPSSSPRVPEVLHQVWFPSTRALPERYKDWQKTWVSNHPGWQVWLWSDTTNRLLVARHYPWLLKLYDSLHSEIMRCDFVRPMYMHRYGGMYVDMDTESLKSMLPLLEGQHVLLAAIGGNAGHQHSINNGFMASRPSESFWMFYLNGMVAQFANQTLMDALTRLHGYRADVLTGPVMLRQTVQEYRQTAQLDGTQTTKIKVLEPKFLFANSWMETKGLDPVCGLKHADFDAKACQALFPEAYALTYFAHDWI